MILRRLSQSLKEQNWTAIVIEFVLLVSGVFLGIEAQQWSNERSERKLERVYLERILSDVNISIETNELNIQRLNEASDGQRLVVDVLRRCTLPDAQKDAFANGLARPIRVGPTVFVLSTMDEMLSAGKFSLIRNARLRDTLNGLARDEKYQADVYAAKVGLITAAAYTTSSRVIRIYPGHKTPFDPVRWQELDVDFNALCQDRPYQAAVSTMRNITDALISLNNRALGKLRPGKAALEAELGIAAKEKEITP